MSFLSDLKNQANALQSQQGAAAQNLQATTQATEAAAMAAWKYLQDLCAQLNVIKPPAPGKYSLDGKAAFPQLLMQNFRCDARKKLLRSKEVFEYVGVGWDLLPATGRVATHSVTVNFPPDLERVTQRIAMGQIPHERKDLRHPETNKLQAYVFEYQTQSRGSITLTPDHDTGNFAFRVVNVGGFELMTTSYPSPQVNSALLDELAKKLVGQTSRFV